LLPIRHLMKAHDVSHHLRLHWPLALLMGVGLALIFTNLGSDYLGEDEGDTAVLASNILKFGVPKAWNGAAFLDSDHGARLNSNLVMVLHPWVPYYLTAGSFLILGQNTFAARLPFALAAWLSILLSYLFVWRITVSRASAFCAAASLIFSVQFLLYARQCRYFALNMVLICGLLWSFFRMKSAPGCALFVLVAVLFFHTHPYGLAPLVTLGGLSVVYKPFLAQRRWICLAAPAIAALTVPWLALSPNGVRENTAPLHSTGEFFERFAQAAIECTSVTPFIGALVLFLIGLILAKLQRKRKATPTAQLDLASASLTTNETSVVLTVFAITFCYILAMAVAQTSDMLWRFGMRYASAVLPLVAMAFGILIVKISRGRFIIWVSLLLLFSLTKLGQLTPWMFWNRTGVLHAGNYSVAAHIPLRVPECFFGTGLSKFVRDLWRQNLGTVAKISEFLRGNAKPGDVVIVNCGVEPIYFYTRLPQALGILPFYPIYDSARQLGLPEFVFGIDHVRWVVWRSAWEGFPGYTIDEVLTEIRQRGGRRTNAFETEETIWENSDGIHFHRFSDGTYLFPISPLKMRGLAKGTAAIRDQTFPPSHIVRVDWPNE
jgi:Dolichyl-phosphate-mannose-protein mannosyltransferase